MLTNDKLTIFEVFKIDKTLPKFRGKEAVNLSSGDWDLVDSDSESFSEDPGVRRPPSAHSTTTSSFTTTRARNRSSRRRRRRRLGRTQSSSGS